mmetsp:Transcript_8062/g.17574  ORF Transcript_8062/g.17574 Transcript_8062/m.17574 type:complete len:116 (+) Transcript_8062:96-443(+)
MPHVCVGQPRSGFLLGLQLGSAARGWGPGSPWRSARSQHSGVDCSDLRPHPAASNSDDNDVGDDNNDDNDDNDNNDDANHDNDDNHDKDDGDDHNHDKDDDNDDNHNQYHNNDAG